MENRGSMYRMKEFSAMTGLPQSKIRFYEKHGLILSDRQENGYRVFTPEDAFKSNAFRVLLQYGFSIDEAVAMLDAKQGTEEFERSLLHQQEKLMHEADLIAYRLRRLESTLGAIQSEPGLEFELVDAADQVYINSSYGRDFHVSLEHEKTISQYYNLLSITSCARIIKRDDLLDNRPTVNPDYVMTMPEHESYRLDEGARKQVKRLCLGKCIRFRRQATRTESVQKETFTSLFEHLDSHGYRVRNDIILLPLLPQSRRIRKRHRNSVRARQLKCIRKGLRRSERDEALQGRERTALLVQHLFVRRVHMAVLAVVERDLFVLLVAVHACIVAAVQGIMRIPITQVSSALGKRFVATAMAAETLLVGNVGARLARHRLGLRTLARPGIGLLRRTTRYREHRHQRNRHEGNHNVQTQGRPTHAWPPFNICSTAT